MNEQKDIEMSFCEVNLNNWRSPRSQLFRHGGSYNENKPLKIQNCMSATEGKTKEQESEVTERSSSTDEVKHNSASSEGTAKAAYTNAYNRFHGIILGLDLTVLNFWFFFFKKKEQKVAN